MRPTCASARNSGNRPSLIKSSIKSWGLVWITRANFHLVSITSTGWGMPGPRRVQAGPRLTGPKNCFNLPRNELIEVHVRPESTAIPPDMLASFISEPTDGAVETLSKTINCAHQSVLEDQVTNVMQADRKMISALLQSHRDTVSLTMIRPNGINSKIVRFLIS